MTETLDNDKPQGDIASVSLRSFLPSRQVCNKLRDDFIVLTARAIVSNIPALETFKNVVPEHIPHQYMNEMQKASEKAHALSNTMQLLL